VQLVYERAKGFDPARGRADDHELDGPLLPGQIPTSIVRTRESARTTVRSTAVTGPSSEAVYVVAGRSGSEKTSPRATTMSARVRRAAPHRNWPLRHSAKAGRPSISPSTMNQGSRDQRARVDRARRTVTMASVVSARLASMSRCDSARTPMARA
jgi:hypothetical protein